MSLFNRLFSRTSHHAYNQAMEAFDRGEHESAITGFREVLKSASEGSTVYVLSRFFVTQCRVQLANSFLQAGLLDEAHATFLEIVKQHPLFPDLHCRLGEIAERREQWKEAEMRYGRALEINPRYREPRLNMVLLRRRRGQFQESLEHVRVLAEAGVSLPETWVAGQPGDDDPATVDRLRSAMVRERESADHVRTGAKLYQAGDLEGALSAYERAVETNPEHADIRCRLATVLGELGRLGDAIHHFTQTLEQNPAYEEARLKRGVAHFQMARFQEALQDFEELFQRNPTNPEICLLVGICQHRIGKTEDAITQLRIAVKNPTVAQRAAFFLAQAYALLDRPERAIECLEPIPVAACQMMLGRLLLNHGRAAEAIRILSRTVHAHKRAPGELSVALSAAHLHLGDLEAARRFAEAAQGSDSTSDDAALLLARIAFQRGEDDAARDWLEKLRPARRQSYEAQVLAARTLARGGRLLEARGILEKAVQLRPGDPAARRALGLVLRRQGHVAQGNQLLSAAISDPADPLWGLDLGGVKSPVPPSQDIESRAA